MTRTYWHVAPSTYQAGNDLLCWEALKDQGIVTDADWKWDEAPVGHDGDIVCLFPDTESGRKERDWMADDVDGAIVVRVDIPEDADDVDVVRASCEDYPAIVHAVPAHYITVGA